MIRPIDCFKIFIIVAGLFLVAWSGHHRAWGTSLFPPVGYLAKEFWPDKSQPLPKGVVYNGRPFFFYVVSAKELPNGEYDVRIKAR